jgi:formylglycine-generating enzyme required for sulfatase activity
MYPWGNNTINASLCNYFDSKVPPPRTTPVGHYRPHGYGLSDMAGNVFEWCSDWYDDDYYRRSPTDNPLGSDTGVFRVLRGGYYRTTASGCRIAFRYKNTPATRNHLGFRPARNIQQNQ